MIETWDIEEIPPLRDALSVYSDHSFFTLSSDYGVTELIAPPQMVQLRHRYRDDILRQKVDLKKQMANFVGNSVHRSLEWYLSTFQAREHQQKYLVETKLFDMVLGRRIAGKIDVWRDEILYDYKTTSTFKYIKQDFEDYEKQGNVYAYLLRTYKKQVKAFRIILIFTDWSKKLVFQERGYPKQNFVMIELDNLWHEDKQRQYYHGRVKLMIEAEQADDDELPLCTVQEMWAKPNSWAVYGTDQGPETGSKAKRVVESREEADNFIRNNPKKVGESPTIQFRPGHRMRCEEYCDVSGYCRQFTEYMDEKQSAEDE